MKTRLIVLLLTMLMTALAAGCDSPSCVGSATIATCCGSAVGSNCAQTAGCQEETVLPPPAGSPPPCGDTQMATMSCVPATQPVSSGGAACHTLDRASCLQREDCAITLQTTCTSTGGYGSQVFSCVNAD